MDDKEKNEFDKWYRELSGRLKLDPNPNHPLHFYDYKSAWRDQAKPDKEGHLPSKYKHDLHPNRFVGTDPDGKKLPRGFYWDTKTKDGIKPEAFKSKFDKQRKELEYRIEKGLF